jgi:hypothetical protein
MIIPAVFYFEFAIWIFFLKIIINATAIEKNMNNGFLIIFFLVHDKNYFKNHNRPNMGKSNSTGQRPVDDENN